MSFNTALSGLAAASADLRVTGDNIANASTIGFKRSRTEFSDVFAAAAVGGGSVQAGSGVKISDIAQQFEQGNISFTDNALDLAIDGSGFFVIDDQGARAYTRSGQLRIDRDGFVVTNAGARVQGFEANDAGTVNGILGDLQIRAQTQAPRPTQLVSSNVNLDSRAPVLSVIGTTHVMAGANAGVARLGIGNGYGAQSVDVVGPDGTITTVSTQAGDSAQTIAATFSGAAAPGTSAAATTTVSIPASGFVNSSGALSLTINGVAASGSTLSEIADSINAAAGIGTVVASIDGAGNLQITDQVGNDVVVGLVTSDPADSVDVVGSQGTAVTLDSTQTDATIGGVVTFTLDEGYTFQNPVPADNLFGPLDPTAFQNFALNTFDPNDQNTYNAATSLTIFDSLGNAHVMTQYFVKERSVSAGGDNLWTMYVQIDGQDVGDPDPSLPPPANTAPTRAAYLLQFNPDGTIDIPASDPVLISNWVPRDASGAASGALGPRNVLDGGALPIPDPAESSNFEIRLNGSTQYGTDFSVNTVSQDGYATGRLSDIDIDSSGFISARYSNGQNQVLGQIALANFANLQGLKPLGNTSWAQSIEAGDPVIGSPGTGSLGVLTSGAIEESNVDLSKQLVNLIIAQRNFQANARTISTADQAIQTVIQI